MHAAAAARGAGIHSGRRRLLAALPWLLAGGASLAAPPLPQRNLQVEMRVVEDDAEARQAAAAGGAVRIDSRGGVQGSATVIAQSRSRQQGLDSVQRVLVLNGGRAVLRLAQGQLVDDTEIWWTPWGPGAVVRSQWIELVNGIEVQPRWPGGDAPVTVELAAQRAQPGSRTWQGNRPTSTEQWSMLSTLQVPLGEWVDVAQVQSASRGSSVSSGGFAAATASRQRSLQLRVGLP